MVKNPSANAGDSEHVGSIPASGRSPGEGKGCLENSVDRQLGGLQSMGSHRVRHDWTLLTMIIYYFRVTLKIFRINNLVIM